MPRPSLAQTIYGSATVIVTAFVLLLLTQTGSSAVAVLIVTIALLLGVLVALVLSTSVSTSREKVTTRALEQTEGTSTEAKPAMEMPTITMPPVGAPSTGRLEQVATATAAEQKPPGPRGVDVPSMDVATGEIDAVDPTVEPRVPQASFRH